MQQEAEEQEKKTSCAIRIEKKLNQIARKYRTGKQKL
jgi:hypothetical protein